MNTIVLQLQGSVGEVHILVNQPTPAGDVAWMIEVPGMETWQGYTQVEPGTGMAGALSMVLARLADDVDHPDKHYADLWLRDRDLATSLANHGYSEMLNGAWTRYAREVVAP